MKRSLFLILAAILFSGMMTDAKDLPIVKRGKAKAVVIQGRTNKCCVLATELLVDCIKKATGVELKVIRPKELSAVDSSMTRIFVGDSDYGKSQGIDSSKLQLEEYRIDIRGRDIFLYGHDKEDPEGRTTGAPGTRHKMDSRQYSPATAWAVATLLEQQAGVRFLWPGDLGTYCPKTKSIAVPQKYAFQGRPYYARRQMWFGAGCNSEVFTANNKYMMIHQQGSRINTWFTDGFQGWYEKYSKTQPELLALSPEGKRDSYFARPIYVKLCISNPKVQEIVLENWRNAGRPDTWSMCPNDGAGFCTCENCRKWDGEDTKNATAQEIWTCKGVNLTRRYITFWNKVITQMRKENPNVYICVFGYGPYKVFPKDAHLEPGVLAAIVPTDFDVHGIGMSQWNSWANSGAKLFNRPNWLNTFWFSPYFPLRETAEFIRMAEPNCLGYEHDTFGGCWPTQGLYCYMIVRMSYRMNLTVDDIKKEYLSAFGKGSKAIGKWIAYWEEYTDRLRGGIAEEADQKRHGLYDEICAKNKYIRPHILYGCWDALADVYSDAVMAPAYALLDEAEKAIGNSDPDAKARVQFLREGMLHVDKMKEVMGLWWKPGATSPEFKKAFEDLYIKRGEWEKNFVLCRHGLMYNEFARRIRIVPMNSDGTRQIETDYVKQWMPRLVQDNGGPVNK